VYTKWRNLKKTKAMEAGQVSFNHPERVSSKRNSDCCIRNWIVKRDIMQVRTYGVKEKDRDIIKALNKSKTESFPDLEGDSVQVQLNMNRLSPRYMME